MAIHVNIMKRRPIIVLIIGILPILMPASYAVHVVVVLLMKVNIYFDLQINRINVLNFFFFCILFFSLMEKKFNITLLETNYSVEKKKLYSRFEVFVKKNMQQMF